MEDLVRSSRVLNTPRGSRGVRRGLGSLRGPGGSEQDYRHEDQGELEGLLGSGRAHECQQGRGGLDGSRRVQKGLQRPRTVWVGQRRFLKGPGGSGRVQEGLGGSRRAWEGPGGPGRVQKGQGGSGRVQGDPDGSQRDKKGLEGSKRVQDSMVGSKRVLEGS